MQSKYFKQCLCCIQIIVKTDVGFFVYDEDAFCMIRFLYPLSSIIIVNMGLFSVTFAYQVIQSSHEGFKLMLSYAALVQGPKGGASPAHGPGRVWFMDGPIQQNQVLFTTSATQS